MSSPIHQPRDVTNDTHRVGTIAAARVGRELSKLGFLIATLSSLTLFACAQPLDEATTPSTPAELVANIRFALNHDLLLSDDFYTEAYLGKFTGGTKIEIAKEEKLHRLGVQVTGFPMLAPVRLGNILLEGVEFQLGRTTAEGGVERVIGVLSFHGTDRSLELDQIVGYLGSGWHEDQEAESQKFMAIAREPFNPPAKPSLIIAYDLGPSNPTRKKNLSLDFGSDRRLGSVTFIEFEVR
jgi:hypothetical protein